ncbi:MAG: efflux RND transporter permease subunit [Acidobacteria bacterium]|nr:efflux RND transporter permease subunit [Acidobacteriota bacterium]
MVRRALDNPYGVIVMVLAILIMGVTVIGRLPTDILPIFKTPAVQILTFYPGMPTETVERDITNRLERWTSQANGIARQESKSMIGVSIVKDYFRPDIDPNTAMSQVSSLAISDLYYLPPGTIPPMVMPFDPTATIPLALLSVSSDTLDEKELYDIAYFSIRNQLSGISGVIAPAVYGGKLRRILVYLDPDKLRGHGLAPTDVSKALRDSNVFIPTGQAKIGELDYQITANGMPATVEEINHFPIKVENGAPVFVRDVGTVKDAFAIQTNVVHVDGKRQVYIPIYRQPGANTIQAVEGVREATGRILTRVPQGVKLDVILDQSHFVREAITSLEMEGVLGALLASIMILFFIGSFRSMMIIFMSIPLSVLAAFIGLYFTNDTINAMTLGGLALAVGRLVDDSIVVLENTHRHLQLGKGALKAARDAAEEVAMPVLVSTITTIVVFFPVIFLYGVGKYLFTPLALSVAFAMAASYVVSMTVVPVAMAFLYRWRKGKVLQGEVTAAGREPGGEEQLSVKVSMGEGRKRRGFLSYFELGFERVRRSYERILAWSLLNRPKVVTAAIMAFAGTLALYPLLGNELFPPVDAGQFMIRARGPSGTRIEEMEKAVHAIEAALRESIPDRDRKTIISNIGVLNDWPAAYTPNSGVQDAFINVQLSPDRRATAQQYVEKLRAGLPERFPGIEFAYDTGGLLTAALNFGLPSPINIQVEGNDLRTSHEIAVRIKSLVEAVPGTADVRIQQRLDYPQIDVTVDRVKAAYVGLTQEDVVKNATSALNSSISFDPAFWIDHKNGNHYFLGVQYPEDRIESKETLENIPVTGQHQKTPVLLRNIAEFKRSTAALETNHVNIVRVIDVYANTQGRDIGSVAGEIERSIDRLDVPSGYRVHMRGEVSSMKESFESLAFGLILAAMLVYLVMVAQFRSFLDPFIIMFAVPLGLIGVIWILLLTGTTVNIQSFMGTIFMVGIAVSNSILLVEFANRLMRDGLPMRVAVVRASGIRLRPILMTSLAAVLGLFPMAFLPGRGAEANVPLALAVIGGLTVSTILTLIVVPVMFTLLKKEGKKTAVAEERDLPRT